MEFIDKKKLKLIFSCPFLRFYGIPSRKLSKLDEEDTKNTAGEVGTSS